MKFRRFFASLQIKFLLPMFGLLLLFIAAIGAAAHYSLSEISHKQSQDFATELADIFSMVGGVMEESRLQRTVQLMAAHKRINSFYVFDQAGVAIASSAVQDRGKNIRELFADAAPYLEQKKDGVSYEEVFLPRKNSELLIHRIDLLAANEARLIPHVLVLLVRVEIPPAVMQVFRLLGWSGLGILLLFLILQFLSLHWIVFRPITRMAAELAKQQYYNEPVFLSQRSIDELGHLSNQYNQLLAQHYASLREVMEARDMAEKSSEFKSQFLANISHEVRTPLNGMLGFAQLLKRSPLNEKQYEYLELMLRSGETLLSIINDVLDYSKIEADKVELHEQPMDIEQACTDVLVINAARAEQKKIDLMLVIDEDVPRSCVLDELRFKQILLNIVSNAVKFTEKGFVVVSVKRRGEHSLCIDVRDTGIGMEREVLASIFRPFVQADASTTKRFGGTGLGLSIAQRLSTIMGGRLQVESQVGIGTNFSILLPLNEPVLVPFTQNECSWAVIAVPELRAQVIAQLQPLFAQLPSEYASLEQARSMSPVDMCFVYLPASDSANEYYLQQLLKLDTHLPVLIASAGQVNDVPAKIVWLEKPLPQRNVVHLLEARGVEGVAAVVQDKTLQGRILLVDDNEINRLLLSDYLLGMGLEVQEAGNGQAAVSICQQQVFDLILMDCLMPVMDGFEAARHIRERGLNVQTPVIAITANTQADVQQACLAAGMTGYLAKPVNLVELNNLLTAYLRPGEG